MKVAIIGAGVGGMSTAIALGRLGYSVEVFERHFARSSLGGGIVCWPNACFVLDELGLLADVAAVSGTPCAMRRFSHDDESLGLLDIDVLNARMGYPSYSILRRDLMGILERHVEMQNIPIHYGRSVTSIETSEKGQAKIIFSSGYAARADLVIGADGRMKSTARKFIKGNNQPVFQRFINWIGAFEATQPVFDEIAVHDYWGIGERFGIVPIDSHRAYWAGGAYSDAPEERNPGRYKEELFKRFEHWPGMVATLIQQTPTEAINKINVYDHDPTNVWYKDNVLMIGDAAHAALPTSGQGACQALEDAWHLARLLNHAQSDLDHSRLSAIFQQFDTVRQSKTAGITTGARHLAASIFNPNPGYCARRNRNSKKTDYKSMAVGMASGWSSYLPIAS